MEFAFKLHALNMPAPNPWTFSPAFHAGLTPAERVSTLWWEGAFTAEERIFPDLEAQLAWLGTPIAEHGHRDPGPAPQGLRARLGRRAGRA